MKSHIRVHCLPQSTITEQRSQFRARIDSKDPSPGRLANVNTMSLSEFHTLSFPMRVWQVFIVVCRAVGIFSE